MCKGQACICCVDLNITFVDLGGPGCVHMKYLSPEMGFAVNVSYGKSLLHSSKIKGADSPPICLDVFGRFAQMCARFSELAPTADGLRGCLQLEPRLLGETQIEFPVGCFRSSPNGMQMEPEKSDNVTQAASVESPEQESESEPDEEPTEAELNAEAFLNVVNHTAEQGIALFSTLLGLTSPKNTTETAEAKPSTETNQALLPSTQSRKGKILAAKHPNII